MSYVTLMKRRRGAFRNPEGNNKQGSNDPESQDSQGTGDSPDSGNQVIVNANQTAVKRVSGSSDQSSFPLARVTWRSLESHIGKLYKFHWVILMKAMTILYLPVITGSILILLMSLTIPGALSLANTLLLFGLYPFHFVAYIVSQAVVARFISQLYLGKKLDLWEGLHFVWQKIKPLLSASVMISLLYLFGAIVGTIAYLIITGICGLIGIGGIVSSVVAGILCYLTVALILTDYLFVSILVVLEDAPDFATAARRSTQLAGPNSRALVRLMLINFLALGSIAILGNIVSSPFSGFVKNLLSANASMFFATLDIVQLNALVDSLFKLVVTAIVFGPATAAVPVFLYYDHRIRYENLTIDQLTGKEKKSI